MFNEPNLQVTQWGTIRIDFKNMMSKIDGVFFRGDPVIIRDENGLEIARGLSAYSNEDAVRIRGLKSSEIEKVLGFRGREEMIHRDDLVIT